MSVFSRKSQLIVPSHTVSKPRVLAIETHAHFGSLLGAMAGVSEGYFDFTRRVMRWTRLRRMASKSGQSGWRMG